MPTPLQGHTVPPAGQDGSANVLAALPTVSTDGSSKVRARWSRAVLPNATTAVSHE